MKETGNSPSTPAFGVSRELNSELVREIVRAVSGIRYGSVEITVHDSKVVQIERKEKVRFQQEGIAK